jgi:cytochrome c oxidase assembly protein subunit 11
MNSTEQENPVSSKSLVGRLALMAVAMFGFGFLMVPLYDAFCEVTGLGGKTNAAPAMVQESVEQGREIRLEFVTTVNEYAPWSFVSQVSDMTIEVGALHEATFVARNLTDSHKTAQAVPSIAPPQAAKYFKKLDCFCFTAQEFTPNQERELPVRFIVDTDLPDYIDTITLSYTFFDTARLSDSSESHSGHSNQ